MNGARNVIGLHLTEGTRIQNALDDVASTVHQTLVLGSPAEEDLMFIGSHKARSYIRSLPYSPPVRFDKTYPKGNPQAVDLLVGSGGCCSPRHPTHFGPLYLDLIGTL